MTTRFFFALPVLALGMMGCGPSLVYDISINGSDATGMSIYGGGPGGSEYIEPKTLPFTLNFTVGAYENGEVEIPPPAWPLDSMTATDVAGSNCKLQGAPKCIAGVCLFDMLMDAPGVCGVNLSATSDGNEIVQCTTVVLTSSAAGNFAAESDRAIKMCP